jgi:hypothetical protein
MNRAALLAIRTLNHVFWAPGNIPSTQICIKVILKIGSQATIIVGARTASAGDYLGAIKCTVKDAVQQERVQGSRGRSCEQWDIWEVAPAMS